MSCIFSKTNNKQRINPQNRRQNRNRIAFSFLLFFFPWQDGPPVILAADEAVQLSVTNWGTESTLFIIRTGYFFSSSLFPSSLILLASKRDSSTREWYLFAGSNEEKCHSSHPLVLHPPTTGCWSFFSNRWTHCLLVDSFAPPLLHWFSANLFFIRIKFVLFTRKYERNIMPRLSDSGNDVRHREPRMWTQLLKHFSVDVIKSGLPESLSMLLLTVTWLNFVGDFLKTAEPSLICCKSCGSCTCHVMSFRKEETFLAAKKVTGKRGHSFVVLMDFFRQQNSRDMQYWSN